MGTWVIGQVRLSGGSAFVTVIPFASMYSLQLLYLHSCRTRSREARVVTSASYSIYGGARLV